MVYMQSFMANKNGVTSITAKPKPVSVAEKKPAKGHDEEKSPYIKGKSIVRGTALGKGYPDPKLEAGSIHKMPGIRAKWPDAIMDIWEKKSIYYKCFTIGFLSLIIALAIFILIPVPYVLAGYSFVWLGFWKLMEGHNHRVSCWDFEMNRGYIQGINYEPAYRTDRYWGQPKKA